MGGVFRFEDILYKEEKLTFTANKYFASITLRLGAS